MPMYLSLQRHNPPTAVIAGSKSMPTVRIPKLAGGIDEIALKVKQATRMFLPIALIGMKKECYGLRSIRHHRRCPWHAPPSFRLHGRP